jgi:hypothetical protein
MTGGLRQVVSKPALTFFRNGRGAIDHVLQGQSIVVNLDLIVHAPFSRLKDACDGCEIYPSEQTVTIDEQGPPTCL